MKQEKNPHAGFSPAFFQRGCDSCVGDNSTSLIFLFHPEKLPLTRSQSTKTSPPTQRNPCKNIHLPFPSHNKQENSLRSSRTNQSLSSPQTRNREQREEKSPYLKRLTHRISPKILLSSVFASVTNTFNGKLSSSITFGPRCGRTK